jgi:short-subunit dehydrogenase
LSRLGPGTVVVTGGSSGLGRATALAFARRGWRVGLIARGAEPLADACAALQALGVRTAAAQADVADSAALGEAAQALAAALGPIDLWINCAGNGVYGRFLDVPEEEFQRVTDVTYHGVVNGTRVALAHMRPRGAGHVLNVCSATAFHGLPMMTSYAGAKAAVRGFTQAVTGELALEGSRLRVSAVFPPAANTPFFSHAPSHMGWPARPAWPVYQPEVVAEGIWQAYCSGRRESAISGTSVVFNLATRVAPGLIAWCMSKLGIDKQTSRAPEASRLLEPTLFTPSRRPLGVRGPFSAGARGWSLQVALDGAVLALTGRLRGGRARPDARPRPGRGDTQPGPALGGLDEQAGAS